MKAMMSGIAGNVTRKEAGSDTIGEVSFSHTVWIAIALLIALLLSPMLFFPLGHDEAMFFVSGEKILQGALPYRDFIEIKPPLIYYLYAGSIALFGHGDASIRIIDFLIQGGTILLMVALVRGTSGNDLWAALAAVLYALTYVGLSPAGTAQTESYVGLLGLGIIRLQFRRRTTAGFLLIGILTGLLVLFKVTFGIVLVGAALAEFIVFERKTPVRNVLLMAVGLAIIGGAFLAWITMLGLLPDFQIMQQYTTGYAGQQWRSPAGWLKDLSKNVPPYIADNYSIALSLATVIGMVRSVTTSQSESEARPRQEIRQLLQIATIMFLLLLLSVAIEQKFAAYQFGRIYPYGVLLASFGAIMAAKQLRYTIGGSRGYRWLMGIVLTILLLLFSPLTRYLWHSGAAAVGIMRGPAGLDNYYDQSVVGYTRSEMKQLGEYVIAHRSAGDQLFVASGYGGLVHRFAHDIPAFKIYHGTPITAVFAPEPWKEATAEYLLHQHPRFIIAQFNDGLAPLNGTPRSSEEGLRLLPGIDSLLNNSYRRVMRTEGFDLYERLD